MPGNDPGIDEDIDELRAVFLLLADCFVIQDRSTDRLTKTRCGDDQFPISAASFLGLRNARRRESLVASSVTLVHRQQTVAIGDQRSGGLG